MKKVIFNLLLLIIIASSCSNPSSKDNSTSGADSLTTDENISKEELVKKIHQSVITINENMETLKTVVAETDESTEGGDIKGYYKNDELVKLSQHLYAEMGNLSEDFYLNNGSIIYYYSKRESYSAPVYTEDVKITKTEETELFFNNNSIIHYKLPENGTLDNLDSKATEILETYKQLVNKINIKEEGNAGNDIFKGEMIRSQVFETTFNAYGDMIFTPSNDEGKLRLYFVKEGNKEIYELPEFWGNAMWQLSDLVAVSFPDVDNDGDRDLCILVSMMTGIGPNAAEEFLVPGFYRWTDNKLEHDSQMNEDLSTAKPQTMKALIEAIKTFQ